MSGGDVLIPLGDSAVLLRPTFSALETLERETGGSLFGLARRFADGTFTLADCVAVVRAGMQGAGVLTPPNDVGERIVTTGVTRLAGPLSTFLHAALTGEDSASSTSSASGS